MININLLPQEYGVKAKTPVKLLLGLSTAIAVNASLLAWWGWTVFGVTAAIESQRATLQTEMDGLTPQVNYHNSLKAESAQYKTREDTLASITSSRVSWTRKLDELIDVINRGDSFDESGGQRHLIWLNDLTVNQLDDARSDKFGGMKASGNSGSREFAQVANFLEDLENSSFIADFHPPAPPEGSESVVDEELYPPVVWAFPLSLDLKKPEDRQ